MSERGCAGSVSRRGFLRLIAGGAAAALAGGGCRAAETKTRRPNVLLIAADDMNWNSPGCFGGTVDSITPNIDRLAGEGLRFRHAHVTIAVCQPSRQTLMTGRFPHRFGALGFEPIDPKITTLQEVLHSAGYFNAILGKVTHLAPERKFKWDAKASFGELVCGRAPSKYYQYAKEFIGQAVQAGKPFFLMANSHDPHRPFSGSASEKNRFKKQLANIPNPSRMYRPKDVDVPTFLPDIPNVRKEVAQYYCSVKRCDDTVGEVLRALRESGQAGNTLVMFLSDNGMAFPFAKTNCYLHSTRTPWIARWPGKIKPGTVDEEHFISGIDFMPTVLELAGLEPVAGMDGTSFLPLLAGGKQAGREHVVTVFHKTAGRKMFPMRCVQNRRFGYIYNGWSDGQTRFRNESQSGLTMKAMIEAAKIDTKIAARVQQFLYRVPEELYDFDKDPDARRNLIADPQFRAQRDRLRAMLLEWMEKTGDPQLAAYRKRLALGK